MSTRPHEGLCELLERLEDDGKLIRFTPRLRGGERCLRRLSLAPNIHQWASRPVKNPALKAAVRSHFKQFVTGEMIDDRDFIKRVERRTAGRPSTFDDEVWSVRPAFEPKYRFFGAFAVPDWLVLFNMHSRANLGSDDAK